MLDRVRKKISPPPTIDELEEELDLHRTLLEREWARLHRAEKFVNGARKLWGITEADLDQPWQHHPAPPIEEFEFSNLSSVNAAIFNEYARVMEIAHRLGLPEKQSLRPYVGRVIAREIMDGTDPYAEMDFDDREFEARKFVYDVKMRWLQDRRSLRHQKAQNHGVVLPQNELFSKTSYATKRRVVIFCEQFFEICHRLQTPVDPEFRAAIIDVIGKNIIAEEHEKLRAQTTAQFKSPTPDLFIKKVREAWENRGKKLNGMPWQKHNVDLSELQPDLRKPADKITRECERFLETCHRLHVIVEEHQRPKIFAIIAGEVIDKIERAAESRRALLASYRDANNADPEFKKRKSELCRLRNADPAFKEASREQARKLNADPEMCAARDARLAAFNQDPDFVAARNAALAVRNADPKTFEPMQEGLRRYRANRAAMKNQTVISENGEMGTQPLPEDLCEP